MPELVPKALSKLTRYPIMALPFNRNAEAVPRELMIDYDTGAIYAKNDFGQIIELSTSINISAVYIRDENGDIVSLQTLLNHIIATSLNVKEVDEMAIFKIPNEAQFDLKSVILKNNLVQVYNFDQAQEDSIPMKIDDRISWVHKDTFLENIGLSISAEGSFDVLDLPIQTDKSFSSVTVSEAKDVNGTDIPEADGAYSATDKNNIWVKTLEDGTSFTATYDEELNRWAITHPTYAVNTAVIKTTINAHNELSLIENKKQQTVLPSGIELDVYLPESTGNLTYSKIIWKVLTGNEAPVLNFMTTAEGQTVVATNIVWEYAESDCHLAANTNNFYMLETWDAGASWFGRKIEMGRTRFEIDEEYLNNLLSNYYTIEEIDEFTNWTVAPY